MAKISGNEIRPGMVIEYQDTLWAVVKTDDGEARQGRRPTTRPS